MHSSKHRCQLLTSVANNDLEQERKETADDNSVGEIILKNVIHVHFRHFPPFSHTVFSSWSHYVRPSPSVLFSHPSTLYELTEATKVKRRISFGCREVFNGSLCVCTPIFSSDWTNSITLYTPKVHRVYNGYIPQRMCSKISRPQLLEFFLIVFTFESRRNVFVLTLRT